MGQPRRRTRRRRIRVRAGGGGAAADGGKGGGVHPQLGWAVAQLDGAKKTSASDVLLPAAPTALGFVYRLLTDLYRSGAGWADDRSSTLS